MKSNIIQIQEVMPRDGLQIEKKFVPTEMKIEIINELSSSGVSQMKNILRFAKGCSSIRLMQKSF